jgi:hypothetical protein
MKGKCLEVAMKLLELEAKWGFHITVVVNLELFFSWSLSSWSLPLRVLVF